MITIRLNGETRNLRTPLTLRELLQETRIPARAIAVAVNSEIVPPSEFETIRLKDCDQVEIVHAVGGG